LPRPDLFIGITSFNSARFLSACLKSIANTTDGLQVRVGVIDNCSTDASAAVAREAGAEVEVRACSQPDAINRLLNRSPAPFTLVVHADVVLLGDRWFDTCRGPLRENCVLVSPEDIGLGPFTRGYPGMPESSFLLFATKPARRARLLYWKRRWRVVRIPWRGLDLYGPHVTHRLPACLARSGYTWHAMRVHTSPRTEVPIYECMLDAANWKPEYARYCYGFGNFYSLDGQVTHYHNWYNRIDEGISADSTAVHPTDHLPLAFMQVYGTRFLDDYLAGTIRLPQIAEPERCSGVE
jgi:glycosyltransferase involved in cell wall biosynthesis